MDVMDSGMVTDVRLVQSENVEIPMDVTDFGMVMDVRLLQL